MKMFIIKMLFVCMLIPIASVLNAQTLRIATGEYPPWTSESLPEGGFINLVVSRVFKEQGILVEYDYMPWNRALTLVKTGQYVASSFWGFDPEREGNFIYSEVIQEDPIVLFYNKKKPIPEWKTLEDLSDFRFGATRGYTYSPGFWKLANEDKLRVSIANDDVANLRKLVEGKIDAFPISAPTGKQLLAKHFDLVDMEKIAVGSGSLNSNKDFLLFSGDWAGVEVLVEQFNIGLKRLKESGEIDRLREEFMKTCCLPKQ